MENTIVDIAAFQKDTALDQHTLKDLYLCFVDEMQKNKLEINQYQNKGDIEQLQKVIHNIKGVSGSYRSGYLYDNAQKIYIQLKNNELEHLNGNLEQLNKQIDQTIEFILQHFK